MSEGGGRASADRANIPTLRVPELAAAATPVALRQLPHQLLAHFLDSCRWFGAKGGALARITVHDVIPLTDNGGDADGADEAPLAAVARLEVELRDGRVERYQLPLVVRPLQGAGLPTGAVLARLEAEDGGRGVLLDALEDAGVRRLIGRGLEAGARYTHDGTSWTLAPEPGVDVAGLADAPATLGNAEQSNSAIIYGDRAILKLYRKLEAGKNPDVEMTRALATRSSFQNVPRLLGTITFEDRDGGVTVAGMLQRLVPGARDGWTLALESAGAFLDAPGDAPPNPFAADMEELGRVTRELHEALLALGEEPGFEPIAGSAEDVQEWAARVRDMIRESTGLLARARDGGRLHGPDVAIADAVLRRRAELLADVDAISEAVGEHPGSRVRHHGDYHLGQVLRGAEGRFMIIDFEGEPARLLSERRAPNSALRDVAGMLRSFSYAAATAAIRAGGVGVNPAVEVRTARWERAVREAFLRGYMERGGAEFLPDPPSAIPHLITLFEMEKVFYELSYEINNRPDWVWIPLRGIGKLLGSPAIPRRGGR